MAQRILVSDAPRQTFTVRLGANTYRMRVWWNRVADGWFIDITSSNGTRIISGVRLTNERRLLQGYRIDFAGDLFVSGRGDPGRQAWSTTHQLIWIEPDE